MSMWKDISPRGGFLSYECLLGLIIVCVLPLECTESACNVCVCHEMTGTFYIDCNSKGLFNVPDHGFPGNTTKIELKNNKINSIRTNDFITAKKLQNLYLENNNISTIQPNAFRDLTSLISLVLSNNHISHLDSQTFQGLLSLEYLYLNRNEITDLKSDTFFFMPDLERVISSTTFEFQCDCKTIHLRDWAYTNSLDLPPITCANFLDAELKDIADITFGKCPVQATTCMECNTTSVETCLRKGTLAQCSQMNSCQLTIDVTNGQQTVTTQCQKVEECIHEMRNNPSSCVNGAANQRCGFCCTGNNCTASLDYSGYTYQTAMLIQFTLNSIFNPALVNKTSSKFIQESGQITNKMNDILSSVNGVEINVSSFKKTANGLTRCNLNTTSVWVLNLSAEAIQNTLFTTLNGSIGSIGLEIVPGSLFLAPPGFCHQENMLSGKGKFHWEKTLVGNEAIAECPFSSFMGSVGKRTCVVGKSSDPVWGDLDWDDCLIPSINSKELMNLANEVVTTESVAKIAYKLHELTSSDMIATDVQYISLALKNLLETPNVKMNLESGENVLGTYNNLMNLDNKTLQESQKGFGSINRSLAMLDNLSGKLDTIPPDGTITLPQVALGVLSVNSSTGGAVFRIHKSSENEGFDPQRVTLTNNTASKPNETAVAIEIPASSLKSNNKLVQFVAFTDDTLFKAMDDKALHHQREINSQIVSASIDNQHVENLPDPIRITFNHKSQKAQNPKCVYWDFGNQMWSPLGCRMLENEKNEYTVCQCDHLTYFALLLDMYGAGYDITKEHEYALTMISHIGCSISLASLLLTLMAYLFFRKLRKDNKAKLLMNLCSALIMVMIFFIIVSQPSVIDNTRACQVAAGLLHYFVMATWTWMAVEAFYMYFSIIKVFNSYVKHLLLKCCVIGWGVPAVIVITTVAISTDNYGEQGQKICWIAGKAFYGGCAAPILFILVGNFMVFGLVMHQVRRLSARSAEHGPKVNTIKTQLRGAFALVGLLGLTWVFAIFAYGNVSIVFIYLFTIFNSLQGLSIFIFHCAMKREVKDILQEKLTSLSSSSGTATRGLSDNQSPSASSAPGRHYAVTTINAVKLTAR